MAQAAVNAVHGPAEQAHDTEAGKLGIWLFILSEILLFGGFLASYLALRLRDPLCALGDPAWPAAGYLGGLALASFNTAVLLTSSYTMVSAVRRAHRGDAEGARGPLLTTMVLGALFLAVKGFEYHAKISHGLVPSGALAQASSGLSIFLSFYFAITGLHALHVLIGLLWNASLFSARAQDKAVWGRKLELAGLYWHFVDVIWVFVFPLFYLI